MSKKLASNIVSGISSRIAAIVIGISSVPVYLSYWGTEQYGIYVAVLSVLAFVPLTSLGVGSSLSILSAKTLELDSKIRLMLQSCVLMLITSIVAFFVVTYTYFAFKSSFWGSLGVTSVQNPIVEAFLYLLLSAFSASFFSILNGAFNGVNRQDLDNWYSIPISAIPLMSILLTRFYSLEFVDFAIITLVSSIFINGIKLYHLIRVCDFDSKILTRISIFNTSDFKHILRVGSRLLVFTLSVIIITNIDNILIIKYFDSSIVSSYSINLKLMNVLFGSVMVVNLAIAPLLGNYLGHDNIQRIKGMYNDSFYICIVLCCFLFTWLLYVGNDVIVLWTSTDVLVSKGIFISMLSFACMYTMVNLHVTISSAMNFTKTLPFIGLFEVLLNIVLSIILLSHFGVLGVILGSLIASILIPSIIHPILIKKLSDEQIYIEKRLVIQCLAVIAPVLLVSIYSYVFEVYAFSKFTQLALVNIYLIFGFYYIIPLSIKNAIRKLPILSK